MTTAQPFALPPKKVWIDRTSVIQTDMDSLYALISDIDNWPTWTPGLCAIKRRGHGFAHAGSHFLMVLEAPLIKRLLLPTVMYQNDKHRMEWGGGALGSHIRHAMVLKALDANTTQLRHIEYATGLLAILTWPAANFAHRHDLRWSQAIEAKFNNN